MVTDIHYTPIETAMLKILSDGKPHTREELHACCGPSSRSSIGMHISSIRKKIRPIGQDVVCVASSGYKYQHVRLLVSPYDPYAS